MKKVILDLRINDARHALSWYVIPAAEFAGETLMNPAEPTPIRLQASFGILDRSGLSPQAALWREEQQEQKSTVQFDFWGKLLIDTKDDEVDVDALIREDNERLDRIYREMQEEDETVQSLAQPRPEEDNL